MTKFIKKGLRAALTRSDKFVSVEKALRPYTKDLGYSADCNTYIAIYFSDRMLNGSLALRVTDGEFVMCGFGGYRANLRGTTRFLGKELTQQTLASMRPSTLTKYANLYNDTSL